MKSFEAHGWVLRPYRLEDAEVLYETIRRSHAHLAPWMPWVHRDDSVESRRQYIETLHADWAAEKDYTMGLFDGDNLLAGTGFHLRVGPEAWKNAEIGMWVSGEHAGKGVGTRLLGMLLTWGFSDEWGWERLIWKCDSANIASCRVAEKNGLRREGHFRRDALNVAGERTDTYLYALLREEFLAR